MNRLIVLAVACLAVTAEADVVDYWPGRMDGNEWRRLSENIKTGYVVGIIDGFYFSLIFGAEGKTLDDLHECIANKPSAQMKAIVQKYHTDHPEMWDQPMSRIVTGALDEICPAFAENY